MTRFNYRQSAFERFIGGRLHVAGDGRLHPSVVALALAASVVATAAAAEHRRVTGLDAELGALHERIALAERLDARDERRRALVREERRERDAVVAARRDSAIAANTIARIGNHLPPQTWLTSVQNERAGSWSIAGRSTRVDRIGTMLVAIGRLEPVASARLVSIDAAGQRGRLLDFVIALESPR